MKAKMIAMAATTVLGLGLSSAQAEVNPFEMNKLSAGYSVAMSDSPDESKCGGQSENGW